MAGPLVPSRIEKRNDFPGSGVNACNIGALVVVASEASQAKIAGPSHATVFSGDDVIDMEGEPIEALRYLTVLAAFIRALPNHLLQGTLHASLI
jgi:hypothetical protein